MENTALEINGLTKRIGKKVILQDLGFQVKRGEIMGFLGPNGAGKTTTIRMILGLASIDAGEIKINHIDIKKDFKTAIASVGGIVENPSMYRHLSGYKNLVCFARMHGPVNKKRIDEIVQYVKLEDCIRNKVKTYSLGMRQRLGIAQAIYHSPSLLILDEPTNGLDPAGICELRELLVDLAKHQNIAVLVSSHILAEMELMCDRVAIIHQGTLVKVLSFDELHNIDLPAFTIKVDAVDQAQKAIKQYNADIKLVLHEDGMDVFVEEDEMQKILYLLLNQGIKLHEYIKKSEKLEQKFIKLIGGAQGASFSETGAK